MKKKLLKGLVWIAVGYALLVALHFVFLATGGHSRSADFSSESAIRMEMPAMAQYKSHSNYATLRFEAKQGAPTVDQKYEKIGSLDATTENFDADEQRARKIVQQHSALIQGEIVNRNDRLHQLNLTIGVPPSSFDVFVGALKTVGKAGDFQVTKTDKTNDYLELKAKRTTLEKARDSLVALKSQGGKIEELVKLEQEILKLEDQIQGLGVQLGQFDQVNEFCTVRFTLSEVEKVVKRSPHMGYLMESLQWASTVYLVLLACLFVGFLCVLLVLSIAEKAKLFRFDS